MTESDTRPASETPLSQLLRYALWYYVWHRRGWIVLLIAAVAAAAALNWGWLAAAGMTSVLLAFLPCAAMCALGLCMHRTGGKKCESRSDFAEKNEDLSRVARLQARSPEAQSVLRDGPSHGDTDRPTTRASASFEVDNIDHHEARRKRNRNG